MRAIGGSITGLASESAVIAFTDLIEEFLLVTAQ
jgi:hypothetical protein